MNLVAYTILQVLIFLMFYVFLLVLAINDKKLNEFVKGLIIIVCSIQILLIIGVQILGNLLRVWQPWNTDVVQLLINSLYSLTTFMLLYCLSFFIGKSRADQLQVNENMQIDIERRNVWQLLLLFFVTISIYWVFWLYHTVKDLRANFQGISYTPGQAVGYLFIPFFNIYWTFKIIFTLPLYVARIEKKYYTPEHRFQFHPVLISLLWILFLIYSYLTGYLFESNNDVLILILTAILFPVISIWIILLTIQAKINSFVIASYNNKVEVSSESERKLYPLENDEFECSECGTLARKDDKYCSNCGERFVD